MTNYFDIKGNSLNEIVGNAKKQNLKYFVQPVNSSSDHYYFFETELEAHDYASKFEEEMAEVWNLNDEMEVEVLLEE